MAKDLIDKLLDSVFDENWTGRWGERLTERELALVRLFGRKGKVLRNIYVPKDNGETTEIDVLFITQKGIFVMESKNYSGWIFGDEESSFWTASLPGGTKNRFYNPIRQNAAHLKWLAAAVGSKIPLFSLVVFSERCELKKVTVRSDSVHVIKRDRLYAAVRDIWDSSPDTLTDEQVTALYERLKALRDVDNSVKEKHVEDIRQKYQTTAPASHSRQRLCPRCGGALVLRTASKGPNAGRQFYGCSSFPQCRYTEAADPSAGKE